MNILHPPKCIGRKVFLLIQDPRIPCQDYREGQPWKTLAYAQALQYWAEKANLPKPDEPCLLVRCVHELRWSMRPFTTFTDGPVFKGTTPKQGTWRRGPLNQVQWRLHNPCARKETCYFTREANCSIGWGARCLSYCFRRASFCANQGAGCPTYSTGDRQEGGGVSGMWTPWLDRNTPILSGKPSGASPLKFGWLKVALPELQVQ